MLVAGSDAVELVRRQTRQKTEAWMADGLKKRTKQPDAKPLEGFDTRFGKSCLPHATLTQTHPRSIYITLSDSVPSPLVFEGSTEQVLPMTGFNCKDIDD